MRTTVSATPDTSHRTDATTGISVANPLQQPAVEANQEGLAPKQNPFLSLQQKTMNNPLRLVKTTPLPAPSSPVQLMHAFSRKVLEEVVIPFLLKEQQGNVYLPAGFISGIQEMSGKMMEEKNEHPEWTEAVSAVKAFFEEVFNRYHLRLGMSMINRLGKSMQVVQEPAKGCLIKELEVQFNRMKLAVAQDGYRELDPEMVDMNQPPPLPMLKGLIWNLHGFSNVVDGEDYSNFRIKGGQEHGDRESMVNELMYSIGFRIRFGNKLNLVNLRELELKQELWNVDNNELAGLSSPLLNEKQKNLLIKYIALADEKFAEPYLMTVGKKFRVTPKRRKDVIKTLENAQKTLNDEQKQAFKNIDALLNQLRASEVVDKIKIDPGYISNLITLIGNSSLSSKTGEPDLLLLIHQVKELRNAIKALSAFLEENGVHPLQQALSNLSKALNELMNRNDSDTYYSDDQNLTVYLDKELNKYGIVSHLISLLNSDRTQLDFMLLNEMNRGINSFTDEVSAATKNKYKVARGPQMAAMNKKGAASQREYYPLVYDQQKFVHKGARIFFIKEGRTFFRDSGDDTLVPWMKPEKKKKAVDIQTDTFLDFRPIVVHRLKRVGDLTPEGENEIWLAAVHTTPYGSEFNREKIFEELEGPLKFLKQKAKEAKAELIIGGDFYIAAEALAKKKKKEKMYTLSPTFSETNNRIFPSVGKNNENRNLRNRNLEGINFTKVLSGDKNPLSGWRHPHGGMGLQDLRSITGTNRNSMGLQSADYFIVPDTEKDRTLVGLIDPRTHELVEMETDDQQISGHNFHFSDHLISGIELYRSPEDKERAELYKRQKDKVLAAMYHRNVEDMKKSRHHAKKQHGEHELPAIEMRDFEPQPGIDSLITTILFHVWSRIFTWVNEWKTGLTPSRPVPPLTELPKWDELLQYIYTTRETLKKRLYRSSDKNNINQLNVVLKTLNDQVISEYAGIIQDLIDKYVEDRGYSSDPVTIEDMDSRKISGKKNEWGLTMEFPSFQKLPEVLKTAFGEEMILADKIDCYNDAGAVLAPLQGNTQEPVRSLIAALQRTNDIEDPEVNRLISACNLSIYLYQFTFFRENAIYYTNHFKYRYGRGFPYELRILHVSSGLLLPPYHHAGYYLLIKPDISQLSDTSGSGGLDKDDLKEDDDMHDKDKGNGKDTTTDTIHPVNTGLSGHLMKQINSDENNGPSFKENLLLKLKHGEEMLTQKNPVELQTLCHDLLNSNNSTLYGVSEYWTAFNYLYNNKHQGAAENIYKQLLGVVIPQTRIFYTWENEVEQMQLQLADGLETRGVGWKREAGIRTKLAIGWLKKYQHVFNMLDKAQQKIIMDALNAKDNAEETEKAIAKIESFFVQGKELIDGNCLFAALVPDNSNVSLQTANEIRQIINKNLDVIDIHNLKFNEIKAHDGNLRARMLYGQISHQTPIHPDLYREFMSINGVWGGDPEIKAFTRTSRLAVYILEPGTTSFRLIADGQVVGTHSVDVVLQHVKAQQAIAIKSSGWHFTRLLPKHLF